MRNGKGFFSHIMAMMTIFKGMDTTRMFNRTFHEQKNEWHKNSNSNPYRGKRTPKHKSKTLAQSHFGTFTPLKKLGW